MLGEFTFQINSGAALDSADQRAGLILLASMLLSFGFIRFSTRMIRAEVSWWPGNVAPGGVHIHHLVFGIVFMMVAGFVAFAVEPGSPWLEIFAAIIAGGYIIGFTPLDATGSTTLAIVSSVVITLAFCALVALKGKLSAAVIGMFIPPVAWVGAIRLARPNSWWARRRYAAGSRKLAKAEARKATHDRRVRRFQDLVGGAPSLPSPRAGGGSKPPRS